MPKSTLRWACVVFAAGVTLSPSVQAFCRSTTCDPRTEPCEYDDRGCNVVGVPLYWDRGEVSLHVASEGSTSRDISADDFEAATSAATETWQRATCAGGKKPSLSFAPVVLAVHPAIEFIKGGENQSVVVFQDDSWLDGGNAIAVTSLAFYERSGALIDTDIALNSQDFDFTTSGAPGPADLQAVLTHEIGHVLGIDHSDVEGATMEAETGGSSTVALRSLSQDDVDAVCTIYPPASEGDPGCTIGRGSPRRGSAALAWLGVLGAAARLSRRRSLAT